MDVLVGQIKVHRCAFPAVRTDKSDCFAGKYVGIIRAVEIARSRRDIARVQALGAVRKVDVWALVIALTR